MSKNEQGNPVPKPIHWVSTYCFRMFRRKHTTLSRLYWTFQLGNASIRNVIIDKPGDDFVVDQINPDFPRGMLPETCKEFLDNAEERAGIVRLHLLVICSANFEAYIQDAVRLHVGSLGHAMSAFSLDPVGKALASPVLRSSTIPEMLKYVEKLLKVTFDKHLDLWKDGYKLRCAAAHNGGIFTADVKRELPTRKLPLDSTISLDWTELKSLLGAADEIAAGIDRAVANDESRKLEAKWILEGLKANHVLPNRENAWQYVSENYSIRIPKKHQQEIEQAIYTS